MIYALIHYKPETMGLIETVLQYQGIPFQEVNLYEGALVPACDGQLEGLVVMGGPMGVDDFNQYSFLKPELKLIEDCLKKKKPILGICLGSQLIAKALGSKVFPNKDMEVGWYLIQKTEDGMSDSVFGQAPRELTVLHWHGDTFDLPQGATHLAKSDRCLNQAFRYDSTVYAFQFHLETTPPMIEKWVGSNQGKMDIRKAGEDGQRILNQTDLSNRQLEPLAKKIFESYFQQAYTSLNESKS